jgi:hypothetical protein
MHHGCAQSIEQRFDPSCGGTNHRDAQLTEADVTALVAYLASL